MELKKIKELATSFQDKAAAIEREATNILVAISNGTIPEEADVNSFNADIDDLRKTYDELFTTSKSYLDETECPKHGTSVAGILEVVENSKSRLVKMQVDHAKESLKKFIKIKSMLDRCSEALRPFQIDAGKLLDVLNESNYSELQNELAPSDAFIEAFERNDFSDDEGFSLLDRIDTYFPRAVSHGLTTHHYFLSEDEEREETTQTVKSDEDLTEEKVGTDIDEVENLDKQETTDTADTTETAEQSEQIIPETKSDPDISAETVIMPEKPVNRGEPNAKPFIKEIARMARKNAEICLIMPILTNLGVLSKSQIMGFGECLDDLHDNSSQRESLSNAVTALCNKGYLSSLEYTFEGKVNHYYCFTEYAKACLYKKSIQNDIAELFAVSRGSNIVTADKGINAAELETILQNNNALLKYLRDTKKIVGKDVFNNVIGSFKWTGTGYEVLVPYKDEFYKTRLVINEGSTETYANLLCSSDIDTERIKFSDETERIFTIRNGEIVCVNLKETEPKEKPVVQSEEYKVPKELQTEESQESDEYDTQETFENPVINFECESEEDISESTDLSVIVDRPAEPKPAIFKELVYGLLTEDVASEKELKDTITKAVLLAHGAGLTGNEKNKALSAKVRLATHLMVNEGEYTSDNLNDVFANPSDKENALKLAAYMFAMLTPSKSFDFVLRSQTDEMFKNYSSDFAEFDSFKPLYNVLLRVKDASATGYSAAAIALLGDDSVRNAQLNELRKEAVNLLTVSIPNIQVRDLPALYNKCFGQGSELYECIQMISEGKKDPDDIELINMVLRNYCDENEESLEINDDTIESILDENWNEVRQKKTQFKLFHEARSLALRLFRERLELMLEWTEYNNSSDKKKIDISRLKKLKEEILKVINSIENDTSWKTLEYSNILSWLLCYIKKYLKEPISKVSIYSDLISTGVIGMKDDGTPDVDPSMAHVLFYEPWRNAIRHILARRRTQEELVAEINGDDFENVELRDNFHQLRMLGKLMNSHEPEFEITETQILEGKASANDKIKEFTEELELAYIYNRINEPEKETLEGIIRSYQESFYEKQDFGRWEQFVEALRKQCKKYSSDRKKMLFTQLKQRLNKSSEAPILTKVSQLLNDKEPNFAVAEEYMNRFDAGEIDINDDYNQLNDRPSFRDFIMPAVFNDINEKCKENKGKNLRGFASDYLRRKMPSDWTRRNKDDSLLLVDNWPRVKNTKPENIKVLFTCLGINVRNVVKTTLDKCEIYSVEADPTERNKADYTHPISAFGTQLKSPITVVVLYGNYTAQQLVDTVTSLDIRSISIVLVDSNIDITNRRQIGEIFHTRKSGHNPFLLVDRTLCIYLALTQQTQRLPTLLKCTLPSTRYQPFVRDGGSTSDEMFFGRKAELQTIIDLNGASVVYGGRQLGKTALLERAESLCSMPSKKQYAVYANIIRKKTEKEVVDTLISEINKKIKGDFSLDTCNTLKEMCDQLNSLFDSRKISTMHLLIDEVDDFLAAIADEAYAPLQPLVDLKRSTVNNFKFVIAGLHNVCRAKNATSNNGIFGQLGTPLCIKPLSPKDALELISIPLTYLGFEIDRYPHLETILTDTNYYPGILQFFGYRLVETLTGNYSKYYSAARGNPPFTLRDDQLGSVMNSTELNKSIKDKFRWSLELDQRYFMLARCITMLYHLNDMKGNCWTGFPVDEIIDICDQYEIECLKNETKGSITVLLDEMVDMGILGKPEQHLYRLRRSTFVDIIGENMERLEADIIENNKEE